jgi:hypothetical protein
MAHTAQAAAQGRPSFEEEVFQAQFADASATVGCAQ